MKKFLLKSKIALVYLVAAIFGVGTVATAGTTIPLESKVQVANVTSGDNAWHDSVGAKYDEVVKVSVWIHNPGQVGSNQYASNVNVKVSIPGNVSTTHAVTSTAAGSNTATITDVANVNTPVLSKLVYIPGTATRRYNTGDDAHVNFVTVPVSDSLVTTGYNVSRLNPCWNYEEYFTVQARVVVDAVSITKQVRIAGQTNWSTDITAQPGDTLEYQIALKNQGNENLTNMFVWDSLPKELTYVSGSAKIKNGLYPNGTSLSNNIVGSGVNIGSYAPSAAAYILLQAKVPTTLGGNCIKVSFNNVANVKSDQMGAYNATSKAAVSYPCIPQALHTITALKYEDVDGDGTRDANESPVADWRITLTGNGVNRSQDTASDGRTSFANLANGTYTVTEETRSGWRNTTPTSRTITINNADANVEFGNQRVVIVTRHTITALKYEDVDGDGTRDNNEGAVSGWRITLTGSGVNRTQSTDSNGITRFTNLENGTYTVTEETKDGWKSITGTTASVVINGNDASVAFGNQKVTEPTPEPNPEPTPTPTPYVPTGKGNMPTSGPAEAAAGAAGLTATGGAAWSWLRSKKALLSSLKKIK